MERSKGSRYHRGTQPISPIAGKHSSSDFHDYFCSFRKVHPDVSGQTKRRFHPESKYKTFHCVTVRAAVFGWCLPLMQWLVDKTLVSFQLIQWVFKWVIKCAEQNSESTTLNAESSLVTFKALDWEKYFLFFKNHPTCPLAIRLRVRLCVWQ